MWNDEHFKVVWTALLVALLPCVALAQDSASPRQISGIYPGLAMFNQEGECGTGALVPWSDRLWAITYGPHCPHGSSDKLYEITPDLRQVIRPESVGGTPANRMIHPESGQLLIGPYLIDRDRKVRVLPPTKMPGRITGVARHLKDPEHKAYYATMEEGLYEVDLETLDVSCPIRDGQFSAIPQGVATYPDAIASALPGYHGKGLYSGQGRLVYANNGERSHDAEIDCTISSGALADWQGSGDWQMIRRNQFTEVTGPGGIAGNPNPETDPLWSIGWDHRSLILMVLDEGVWHSYRLPKASHCYDGAHGWNTEWPRIRDVGDPDLLMTMHGMFWKFPRDFRFHHSAGIRPRSTYLKVIGDFCRWQDRLVFGCDDAAKSEFLNKRAAKGGLAGPGQSQSNLWFADPSTPDHLGPALGSGALWLNEPVASGQWSDPFLLAGFAKRSLFLSHEAKTPVRFDLEVDRNGNGSWQSLRQVDVPVGQPTWLELGADVVGEWIRIRIDQDSMQTTAMFQYGATDSRPSQNDAIFSGLAKVADAASLGGLLRTRGGDHKTLAVMATQWVGSKSTPAEVYELDANLNLAPARDAEVQKEIAAVTNIPRGILTTDGASAIYCDEKNHRWRFPGTDPVYGALADGGVVRIAREVCTERDLFNCQGTFYELPADNAGGVAKVRPIATHRLKIQDYVSYRGLLVLTGVQDGVANPHIVRSADKRAAVWLGAVDDLWKLGKPRGQGGPWKHSAVKAGDPSDPYLMNGFDRKSLDLTNEGPAETRIRCEVDVAGDGHWATLKSFDLKPACSTHYDFPSWFQACWVRFVSTEATVASAVLNYE